MFCFCTFPLSNFNISIFILFFFTLRYKIIFCYSFVKGTPSFVSAMCSQRTAVLVYLFYIQRPVLITRFVYKGLRPYLVLFICKGLLSLYFAIHLQITAVLVFLLFICKGLLSMSSAIYLQRTAVLDFCYSFAKDRCPCLVLFVCKGLRPCLVPLVCKETAVLIFRFCPSKLR